MICGWMKTGGISDRRRDRNPCRWDDEILPLIWVDLRGASNGP